MREEYKRPSEPLATLAVLAYNQEQYIREAIKGAFDQDLDNLEIILSDDRSSDSTFSIMQEMANSYRGKHQVSAIQQSDNSGVVNHVIRVSRLAKGQLLILAAGDDISHPSRARKLLDHWQERRSSCVNSRYDEIDEHGKLVRRNIKWATCADTQRIFGKSKIAQKVDGIVSNTVGFSAAYPREFWASLPTNSHRLMIEDGLATCLINSQGGHISTVEESLLSYRIHGKSLSNRDGPTDMQSIMKREARIDLGANDIVNRVNLIFELETAGAIHLDRIDRDELLKERHYGEVVRSFWSLSYHKRLLRLSDVRSLRELAFVLPRCFGITLFKALKNLSERAFA